MTAGAGQSARGVRAGQRLAWLGQGAVFVTCDWLAGLVDWAEDRGLTANSLVGISLLLALCGAVWLSGRGYLDLFCGVLALGGWLLARAVAVGLAAEQADVVGLGAVGQRVVGQGAVGSEGIRSEAVKGFVRIFAVGSAASECAIYGGIAAAGQSGGWTGAWPLAITTVISVTLADMLIVVGGAGTAVSGYSMAWRWIGQVIGAPAGLRVAVAGVALVLDGPQAALACVVAVTTVSVGVVAWRLASRPRPGGFADWPPAFGPPAGDFAVWFAAPRELVVTCRDDGALARWTGRLVQGNIMPLPPICAGISAIVLLAVLGLGGLPDIVALAPLMALLLAAPGSAHPHDGPADWLAPVLLALGQFVYLAALGFGRQVPGPVVFALCALTAIWYVSIAAWSQALATVSDSAVSNSAVSGGGVSDSAVSDSAVSDSAVSGGAVSGGAGPSGAGPGSAGPGSARPMGGLGWESRVFAVTFFAIAGIATVGYLGLSLYLGMLIGRKVVTGPSWRSVAA